MWERPAAAAATHWKWKVASAEGGDKLSEGREKKRIWRPIRLVARCTHRSTGGLRGGVRLLLLLLLRQILTPSDESFSYLNWVSSRRCWCHWEQPTDKGDTGRCHRRPVDWAAWPDPSEWAERAEAEAIAGPQRCCCWTRSHPSIDKTSPPLPARWCLPPSGGRIWVPCRRYPPHSTRPRLPVRQRADRAPAPLPGRLNPRVTPDSTASPSPPASEKENKKLLSGWVLIITLGRDFPRDCGPAHI